MVQEPMPGPRTVTLEYACEKYGTAVNLLATGTGSIQDRLKQASLHCLRAQGEDFPEDEWREEHQAIDAAFSLVTTGPGDGYIEKTLNAMSEGDAVALAERIVARNDVLHEAGTIAQYRREVKLGLAH